MNSLREYIRRHAGPSLRGLVRRAKKDIMGPCVFEVQLGPYNFAPEPSTTPRLTLVIPSVAKINAFGGVITGLEIFFQLAAALKNRRPIDLRVCTTAPESFEKDSVLFKVASASGVTVSDIDLHPKLYPHSNLSTRPDEIFMGFNWLCVSNLSELLYAQSKYFRQDLKPVLYPIQEYEPSLYPFSSDHILAREVYDANIPIFAQVNSSELAVWLSKQGHKFERMDVFEPRLASKLHQILASATQTKRKNKILIYGRPTEDRNCFPILRQGLELFASIAPEYSHWEIVSAGMQHSSFVLSTGQRVRSLGKLTLKDYASVMQECAVGVSLMASPHPSYPPLEMAHFGLLTITNRYAHKNLELSHSNIRSLNNSQPQTLATTLRRVCGEFERNPEIGAGGESYLTDYLSDGSFDFLPDLANEILESWKS